MTYQATFESLAASGVLDERVSVALAHYASFVIGGGGDQSRLTWCKGVLRNPAAFAAQMRFAVIMDANYPNAQTDDDASDSALQGIVETAVTHLFF